MRRDHEIRIGDERILGDSDFVSEALEADQLKIERRSRRVREGWTLERLIDQVTENYGLFSE